MAKPTVYIETTIAGHLTSRLPKDSLVSGQMLATREWWKKSRGDFDCYTSEVVLSALLLQRSALPMKARTDSVHLAMAATTGMVYLLTWNCRHLANATLRATME